MREKPFHIHKIWSDTWPRSSGPASLAHLKLGPASQSAPVYIGSALMLTCVSKLHFSSHQRRTFSSPHFWFTLATSRGFCCSTPPWRRKPHGAPPDNVITTSSATIVWLFFLLFLFSYSLFALLFFVSIAGGPQCFSPMLSNQGPLQRALTCSLPATLSGCWAEVQLQGPHSHLNTHPQGFMSSLPQPEWVNLHREA